MNQFVINYNGNDVFGYKWGLEKGAKANILIVHGMSEHCERYDEFAKYLNSKSYNVYALDHKGHKNNVIYGKDKLGVWSRDSFEECVDRVKKEFDEVSANGLPTYIFSHSMGSFMTQRFMEKYPGVSKKVVLCGTSGPQSVFKFGRFATRLHCFAKKKDKPSKFLNSLFFMGYNKKFKKEKNEFAWLSANEENVHSYIQDEYCGFTQSRGFFLSFVEGICRVFSKKEFNKIAKEPKILLIAGKDDPVGNYGKSIKKLQNKYTKKGISSRMVLYPGLRHEILNENIKINIFEEVYNFFETN